MGYANPVITDIGGNHSWSAQQVGAGLNQTSDRFFNKIGKGISSIGSSVATVANHVFRCASTVKDDTTALAYFLRNVGHTLSGVTWARSGQPWGSKLSGRVGDAINFIDAIQVFSDIHYFASGQYKKDYKFTILGHVAFAVADAGCVLLWVEEMGIKLSRIAAEIGKNRYFSFVTKIPLGRLVSGAVVVGYAFFAADAIHRLVDPKLAHKQYRKEQVTKAWLDLAGCIASIAGTTLGLVGVTCVPVIAGLGIVSASFGLASFLYSHYNEKKLKPQELATELR